MIDVRNLTIKIGDRTIIENLSFVLENGAKLAIVGEEGNGKSTLAKVIAKKEVPYAKVTGAVFCPNKRAGFLPQFLDEAWFAQTVEEFFVKDTPDGEILWERYNELAGLEKSFANVGLSFDVFERNQKIGTLSGGEKVKLCLAKLLLEDADYFVLDEPTNDVDTETLLWIEKFVLGTSKPVVFISHDETLLENCANAILHIEQTKKKTTPKWTFEGIGYADYVKKRLAGIEKQTQVALKERADDKKRMERWTEIYNKVDHDLNAISRGNPHGGQLLKKKMRSVKAQEKRFEREREQMTEMPSPEEAITLKFCGTPFAPKRHTLDLFVEKLCIGEHCLAKNIKLDLFGSEKVVVVGRNGVGKSTFLRRIIPEIEKTGLSVGYMPQNYDEELSKFDTILEFVESFCHSKEQKTLARTYLGSLKFTRDEMNAKIMETSGGQKAKLYLLKLMLTKNDILVLDEPTRNLSPLSGPVIRKALKNFAGPILAVSHDRKFVAEVADKTFELTPEGLKQVLLK